MGKGLYILFWGGVLENNEYSKYILGVFIMILSLKMILDIF